MLDPYTREEVSDFLRQVLEETRTFQSKLSELLEENDQELSEEWEPAISASDTLDKYTSKINGLKHILFNTILANVSSVQQQTRWCELPFNGQHTNTAHRTHSIYTCRSNQSHIFCRSHNLDACVCPICGGVLV